MKIRDETPPVCSKGHPTTRRQAGQHSLPCGCTVETATAEALAAEGLRVRDDAQPVYMLRLTREEIEANLWCINTLSRSWLGSPDGTAIDALKRKLLSATDAPNAQGAQ